MLAETFKPVIDWYMANISYGSIIALMTVESSFIPFPSEIVVPPAAWKAAKGELSMTGVLLSSTLGAVLGALFNYYIALIFGRKMIYRFAATRAANMLMIDVAAVKKSETYFRKHGRLSTFIGRLIPAIRQLISLPAGLAKMEMRSFLLFTAAGAGIWNIILALLGYFLYSQKETLEKYYGILSLSFFVMGVGLVTVVLCKGLFGRKKENVKLISE
jgi:membrane protein DedA with SNARE-associated domain